MRTQGGTAGTGPSLRLGLVGCGGFGHFILEAVAELPAVELVAVSDPDPGRRDRAADLWERLRGSRPAAHAGEAALLAEEAVRAVWIATPPRLHHGLALAALDAGRAVILEKPGALTAGQATEVAAAARARGLPVTVDLVMRRNPIYRWLRTAAAAGCFGALERIALENSARDDHLPPGHWFWDRTVSGGIWVEHGVHFFDLFRWLAGEPNGFRALAVERRPGMVDTVTALALYRPPAGDAPPAVGSHYHAFVKPGPWERTRVSLVYQRAYLEVEGWIAEGLRGEAWLAPGVTLPPAPWLREETSAPLPSEAFTGRGCSLPAATRLTFSGRLPDRWQVYRAALQAAIKDLAAALADPAHRLSVTMEDAARALADAEAAGAATAAGAPSAPSPPPPGVPP